MNPLMNNQDHAVNHTALWGEEMTPYKVRGWADVSLKAHFPIRLSWVNEEGWTALSYWSVEAHGGNRHLFDTSESVHRSWGVLHVRKVASADNTPQVMLRYRLHPLLRAEHVTVPRRLGIQGALLVICSRCRVWMRKEIHLQIFWAFFLVLIAGWRCCFYIWLA